MTRLLRFVDFIGSLNEDYALVPRFSLKGNEIFSDFPVNKPVDYSDELLVKAIQNGMVVLLTYRGEEDKSLTGHNRVIYPMVLGKSEAGKTLIRGYHLHGWSVSTGHATEKVWRMFRADRVKHMTFTGTFFRLPPNGYNMEDPGMTDIIASADFAQIRANQQALVKAMKVQGDGENTLAADENHIASIDTESTGETLDLSSPWDSTSVLKQEDAETIRVTFLKSQFGNDRIVLLGVMGKDKVQKESEEARQDDERIIKVYEDDSLKGSYTVLDACMATELGAGDFLRVDGQNKFDLYVYRGKR